MPARAITKDSGAGNDPYDAVVRCAIDKPPRPLDDMEAKARLLIAEGEAVGADPEADDERLMRVVLREITAQVGPAVGSLPIDLLKKSTVKRSDSE